MSYFDGLVGKRPPPITNLVSNPRFAPHFVSVDAWGKKINDIVHGRFFVAFPSHSFRMEMSDFFPGLDADLHDINSFVKVEYDTLKHSLSFISQRVLTIFHQSEVKQKQSIALLQKQLDVVVEDLVNLETFIGLNVMFLMKIVLQYYHGPSFTDRQATIRSPVPRRQIGSLPD